MHTVRPDWQQLAFYEIFKSLNRKVQGHERLKLPTLEVKLRELSRRK